MHSHTHKGSQATPAGELGVGAPGLLTGLAPRRTPRLNTSVQRHLHPLRGTGTHGNLVRVLGPFCASRIVS
eukprot:1243669-Alexandrium_andersonii.AAC.1